MLRTELSFQQNLEVKFTVTGENYQRQCRFMATFSEMLRTVASPWVPRPPFLFVNILSLRVPGANINTVPNSAVGSEELSHSAGGPNELGWARPSFRENPQNLYYPLGFSYTTAEMCKTPLFCLSTVPTCLLDFFF